MNSEEDRNQNLYLNDILIPAMIKELSYGTHKSEDVLPAVRLLINSKMNLKPEIVEGIIKSIEKNI